MTLIGLFALTLLRKSALNYSENYLMVSLRVNLSILSTEINVNSSESLQPDNVLSG